MHHKSNMKFRVRVAGNASAVTTITRQFDSKGVLVIATGKATEAVFDTNRAAMAAIERTIAARTQAAKSYFAEWKSFAPLMEMTELLVEPFEVKA